jgi:hypothetical protein
VCDMDDTPDYNWKNPAGMGLPEEFFVW